ncbi:TPA: ead/Ea22-like family protein [Salmonella enterica subsp. enterica serovar Muenchen]
MSNIDKQALREEFRYMQDHYSDPADRERQEIYIAAEALLDENIQLQREKDAIEAVALALRDDIRDARGKLEAAEHRIAEHRKVLNSLAAVARRYLPDYDEHPEIQAADELLESAAGIGVKGGE